VIRPITASQPSRGMLVVLNGASSSGKSTLARLLQGALPGEFLHVQLDVFRAMEPPDYFRSTNPSRNKLRVAALCRSLHRATREFVDHGQNVLLDHVLSPEAWDYLLEDFADCSPLLISVLCSPEELARREEVRGDRKAGLAASQAKSIHRGREYDFSIETTSATPAVCAAEIAAWLSLTPQPAAFMRMRARAPVA